MSQAKEITATYLRTKETMKKYITAFEERKQPGKSHNPFQYTINNPEGSIIQEFNHWFIMKNDFPYDAVADIHHMIVTKREVPFNWNLLTEEEIDEFQTLRENYLADNYDVIYENLPSGQTQPGWFHINLLKLKRTSLEEFMNN
ncbi:MAG: GIG1 family protein [Candidatus Pacebacteria bacterium]|nr:GIG1 family protein [Candidatus Paceibacterota bacterium]